MLTASLNKLDAIRSANFFDTDFLDMIEDKLRKVATNYTNEVVAEFESSIASVDRVLNSFGTTTDPTSILAKAQARRAKIQTDLEDFVTNEDAYQVKVFAVWDTVMDNMIAFR